MLRINQELFANDFVRTEEITFCFYIIIVQDFFDYLFIFLKEEIKETENLSLLNIRILRK